MKLRYFKFDEILFSFKILLIILVFMFSLSCYDIRSVCNQDIRQGNFIEDTLLNRIKIGMNKAKIKELLGNPTLFPISDDNSWCYYYYYIPNNNDLPVKRRCLILYFSDEILISFDKYIN